MFGYTMKIKTNFVSILLGVMLFTSLPSLARNEQTRIVWREHQNQQTGLYSTKNYFVSHGVTFNLSALYYFGDVDNEGMAFHGGFNTENLSIGGGLTFGYTMPAGNHCNVRYSLKGGSLHGNNKEKFDNLPEPRNDYRKFRSIIIQPSIGVEYYPFSNAGFFLYGGLGLTASIITNFEFYYNTRVGNETVRSSLTGSTFGFLPMIQLGLGYSWRLADSWILSAEVLVQEGLVDTHYLNLDAWPLSPNQNSEGKALGSTNGKWTDGSGQEHIRWNDGWFEVGISVSYRWSNCERCRALNTYFRPRRR